MTDSVTASHSPRTLLPGFGLPIPHVPSEKDPHYVGKPFPNALSGYDLREGRVATSMTTLRELTMLQLMNSITDKPDWHIKVNDPKIVKKWKEEALASDHDITQLMINWCIEELRYKASLITDPTRPPPIIAYDADVVKSDVAVPFELKKELQEAFKNYEEKIPERLRDWHPGSDEKVWDLVHPSLCPLVYGLTRVLANGETTTFEDCILRSGEGEIVPAPSGDEMNGFRDFIELPWNRHMWFNPYSAKFQWLPCEVDISRDEAQIKSYINNLHPEEKSLYGLIEKLITASMPLWDMTLTPIRDSESFRPSRITWYRVEFSPDPENSPETEGPQRQRDEDDDSYWNRRSAWIEATRVLVRPEPPEVFIPLKAPEKFSLKDTYGKRGLQVIVKLANVELTPEKPEYKGGSWHVEGQMNEHIVATSLYYYSCENITMSTLSFRHQFEAEYATGLDYPQDYHDWLPIIFGCNKYDGAVQVLGNVETREGRLLTFPNTLQHRVGPFKLADPTKPGHRKIVALFLVDPNIKVISTANVPCQQQDWWWEAVQAVHLREDLAAGRTSGSGMASFPRELQEHILKGVDFPISLEDAKSLRLALMEERKHFVIKNNEAFEEASFSLCEH